MNSHRSWLFFAMISPLMVFSASTPGETMTVPATKIYRGSITVPCVSPERSQAFSFPSLEQAVKFVLANTPSHADCARGVFRYFDLVSTNRTGPRTYEIVGRSQQDGSTQTIGGVLVQHDCPSASNVGSDTCQVVRPAAGSGEAAAKHATPQPAAKK